MREHEYSYVLEMAREKQFNLSVCPTCDQSKEEIAPGHWRWGSSIYRLNGKDHPCDCAWQDTLRRHYLLADLPKDYWVLDREDWIGDPKAWGLVQTYLHDWEQNKRFGTGIDFYSPFQGTGKTFLSAYIAKQLIQNDEKVWFVPFGDILSTYDMPYEERKTKVQRLRNTPVLILDEISKPITAAQRDYFATELESVIRFRTSGNAVTITTSNLTPEQLDVEYPRVFSLLASKQVEISVVGQDARRAGDLNLKEWELKRNNERKPIT